MKADWGKLVIGLQEVSNKDLEWTRGRNSFRKSPRLLTNHAVVSRTESWVIDKQPAHENALKSLACWIYSSYSVLHRTVPVSRSIENPCAFLWCPTATLIQSQRFLTRRTRGTIAHPDEKTSASRTSSRRSTGIWAAQVTLSNVHQGILIPLLRTHTRFSWWERFQSSAFQRFSTKLAFSSGREIVPRYSPLRTLQMTTEESWFVPQNTFELEWPERLGDSATVEWLNICGTWFLELEPQRKRRRWIGRYTAGLRSHNDITIFHR